MSEENKRPDWRIIAVLVVTAAVCAGIMWFLEGGRL